MANKQITKDGEPFFFLEVMGSDYEIGSARSLLNTTGHAGGFVRISRMCILPPLNG